MTPEIARPADYPEFGATSWCRTLSGRIVASCSGCGFAIREGAHASDVCWGFWCRACCPACRSVPTKEDVRVMARNCAMRIEQWPIQERKVKIRVLRVVAALATDESNRVAREDNKPRAVRAIVLKPFYREPIPERIRAVRAGSKLARGIEMLARDEGVTLAELRDGLKVQTAIRTWLAFDMREQIGYGYSCEDGVTVRLVLPEGMSVPVGHR